MITRVQRLIYIFWPSFLMAAIGSIILFSAIDPGELSSPGWMSNLSRLEAYTVGFLFLWVLTALACVLTCYFQTPEDRICSRKSDKAA